MKPGITCLWQVTPCRNEVCFKNWMKLDLEYIDKWSLWLDFKILIKSVAAVLTGCTCDSGSCEHQESAGVAEGRGEHGGESYGEHVRGGGEHGGESRGEHDRDGGEQGGEGGEESGTELALNETYDSVRNGVRLILTYDAQSNAFVGTVP